MSTLRKAFQDQFEKLPEMVLRRIVQRKLAEADVELPVRAVDALVDHLLRQEDDGNFTWSDAKDESPEMRRNLALSFDEKDAEEIESTVARVTSELPAIVEKVIAQGGDVLFKSLKERWPIEGELQRNEVQDFNERLKERWGEGLNLLRMLLTCCREIGADAHKRFQRSNSVKYACRRFVLSRLHTRACQVADEIVTLLENGFADGAMARWRTLHELAVVATIIVDGDEVLAERYISHDAVDVKRQADDHDTTQVPLGYAPIGPRERRNIDDAYAEAVAKYGRDFSSPYGWAAERLKRKKPTFKDIQELADRAGMNSYYKLASFNIHAGARAMFFRLTDLGDSAMPVAGRSNAGLVEPGQNTAFTLVQITGALIGTTTNLERLVELQSILKIRDAIPGALGRADRKLRKDEKARQRELKKRRSRRQTCKGEKEQKGRSG